MQMGNKFATVVEMIALPLLLHICIFKLITEKRQQITNGKASWQVTSGRYFPLSLESLQFGPGPWHMLDCNSAHSPEFINQPFAVY